MEPSAKVIADSVSPAGHRLTTVEATLHRFVLAELNTHRLFSRNSASSRAIPVKKQVERVLNDPAVPVEWGANQPGMQADIVLEGEDAAQAAKLWLDARYEAVRYAEALAELGVHKQITNRLLEPFMWHTVIISSTHWENFFNQRCTHRSPLAQPEMRACADAIYDAISASKPQIVGLGRYHLPYIDAFELGLHGIQNCKKISAARCARVSYLTHDGKRDADVDIDLFGKLISARPMHASPLEHVATPCPTIPYVENNFLGWIQYRQEIEAEQGINSRS